MVFVLAEGLEKGVVVQAEQRSVVRRGKGRGRRVEKEKLESQEGAKDCPAQMGRALGMDLGKDLVRFPDCQVVPVVVDHQNQGWAPGLLVWERG